MMANSEVAARHEVRSEGNDMKRSNAHVYGYDSVSKIPR
jgi:hypothetical protein